MQNLRHHHIASVLFHIRDIDSFSIIMLPVADYDLLTFLQRKTLDHSFSRIELSNLTSWFGCLIPALAFAHSKRIKHEDIKPNNILIKDQQPYLADFGCAKDFSTLDSSTSIFSLGCVFSEMLTVRQGHSLEEYQS
jgi:serine/threonine protein kinase